MRICLVDVDPTRGEEKLDDGCVSFLARHPERSTSIVRICLVDVDLTRGEEKTHHLSMSVLTCLVQRRHTITLATHVHIHTLNSLQQHLHHLQVSS